MHFFASRKRIQFCVGNNFFLFLFLFFILDSTKETIKVENMFEFFFIVKTNLCIFYNMKHVRYEMNNEKEIEKKNEHETSYWNFKVHGDLNTMITKL